MSYPSQRLCSRDVGKKIKKTVVQEWLFTFWWGFVTLFSDELFMVVVRPLSWVESAKFELSTSYGLNHVSLITFTYIESNLSFYCQAPSKGTSSVTLQSVVIWFAWIVLYPVFCMYTSVKLYQITVYMLIIQNYSQE